MCSSCHTVQGFVNATVAGWTIMKWGVACAVRAAQNFISFEIEQWVTTQMLSTVESQSVRKFLVKDISNNAPPFLVGTWLPCVNR